MSATEFATTTRIDLQEPSLWTVVFLNDDFTPMQFVSHLLISEFHRPADEAQRITMAIHNEGRAQVGSYTREVAANKAERATLLAILAQHPLQVRPERLA